VIPFHYGIMVNNVCSPEMLRAALALAGSSASLSLTIDKGPWHYYRVGPSLMRNHHDLPLLWSIIKMICKHCNWQIGIHGRRNGLQIL